MKTIIKNARVVSFGGEGVIRGSVRPLIRNADVSMEAPSILEVASPGTLTSQEGDRVIEADGRVLMPAFTDAHTHACWAGERLDEWEAKLKGASYLDILKSGGGIMSTVRSVRKASQQELEANLEQRVWWMLEEGTTTIEVKSGYGLTTEDELKMLRAIVEVDQRFPGTLVPTALLAHAVDADQEHFFAKTIHENLARGSCGIPRCGHRCLYRRGSVVLRANARTL